MKWLLLSCFLLWARHGEGGALKCLPEDDACSSEQSEPTEQEIEIRRPIGAGADAAAECRPGSEWDSNCHSCRCSAYGEAECLKRPDCDSIIEEPVRCKPNTTFQRECNTCLCLESGLGLCTIKQCQRMPLPSSVLSKESIPQGTDCAPGTTWQSQCNDCVCSPTGRRHCTEKTCPGQESEPLLRCAPQSQWKNDCNLCWCASGRAVCTKMGCEGIPVIMNFDDQKEIPESETPEMNNLPPVPDITSNVVLEIDTDEQNLIEDNLEKDHNIADTVEDNLTGVNLKDLDDYDHNDIDTPKLIVAQITTNENDDSKVTDANFELPEVILDQNIKNRNIEDDLEHDNAKDINKDLDITEDPYLDYNSQVIHRIQKRSPCKPNQEFQNDCNTCKCSASGQSYACTQNECMDGDKEEVGKEVDKEVEVFMESEGSDHIERHSVCKASSTFFVSCNTCHCNADGTNYSCTNKPCPPPPDVEVFHELHEMDAIVPYKENIANHKPTK